MSIPSVPGPTSSLNFFAFPPEIIFEIIEAYLSIRGTDPFTLILVSRAFRTAVFNSRSIWRRVKIVIGAGRRRRIWDSDMWYQVGSIDAAEAAFDRSGGLSVDVKIWLYALHEADLDIAATSQFLDLLAGSSSVRRWRTLEINTVSPKLDNITWSRFIPKLYDHSIQLKSLHVTKIPKALSSTFTSRVKTLQIDIPQRYGFTAFLKEFTALETLSIHNNDSASTGSPLNPVEHVPHVRRFTFCTIDAKLWLLPAHWSTVRHLHPVIFGKRQELVVGPTFHFPSVASLIPCPRSSPPSNDLSALSFAPSISNHQATYAIPPSISNHQETCAMRAAAAAHPPLMKLRQLECQ